MNLKYNMGRYEDSMKMSLAVSELNYMAYAKVSLPIHLHRHLLVLVVLAHQDHQDHHHLFPVSHLLGPLMIRIMLVIGNESGKESESHETERESASSTGTVNVKFEKEIESGKKTATAQLIIATRSASK